MRPRRVSILLAAALGSLACREGPAPGRARNVVLISIDTLRPDHLGCYGNERDTSPAIDRMAAAGVRFADVTAAAPWTLPSHATMFTGLYPSHHGVRSPRTRLPADTITLAEEFRDRGFQTYALVSTFNVGGPQFQLGQGFDVFRYLLETERDPETRLLRTLNNGREVVAAACEVLQQRDGGRPFFLFLHLYDAHTDYTPEPEYRERFVSPYSGRLTGISQQLKQVRYRGEALSAEDVRWLKEMYDAEIRQLDDLLGEFLDWLGQQGLAEETLFVLTSDHGEEFFEHKGTMHGRTQYQELLSIPLILAGPGVPRGRVIDTPVHGIDVTPTILGLMGIESRMPRDGLDLSVLWTGPQDLPPRALLGEADHNSVIDGKAMMDVKRMVRIGDDKLCLNLHTQAIELYDLATDPTEQRNLASSNPERVAELRAELERFMQTAIVPEGAAPPNLEEQDRLEALGYGGEGER